MQHSLALDDSSVAPIFLDPDRRLVFRTHVVARDNARSSWRRSLTLAVPLVAVAGAAASYALLSRRPAADSALTAAAEQLVHAAADTALAAPPTSKAHIYPAVGVRFGALLTGVMLLLRAVRVAPTADQSADGADTPPPPPPPPPPPVKPPSVATLGRLQPLVIAGLSLGITALLVPRLWPPPAAAQPRQLDLIAEYKDIELPDTVQDVCVWDLEERAVYAYVHGDVFHAICCREHLEAALHWWQSSAHHTCPICRAPIDRLAPIAELLGLT